MSFRILSTKLLNVSQQHLLLNADIAFVHANFIETVPVDFKTENHIENAIFTSKNAFKAVENRNIQIKNVFCIGTKTAASAKNKNINVVATANNASELAELILKNYAVKKFVFFCGESRLAILPDKLKENGIALNEVVVYSTKMIPKRFTGHYDGVLFYSPSGVESFLKLNSLNGTVAFCIGKTTAGAAEKYADEIITATVPSVENVLVQVIKYARAKKD